MSDSVFPFKSLACGVFFRIRLPSHDHGDAANLSADSHGDDRRAALHAHIEFARDPGGRVDSESLMAVFTVFLLTLLLACVQRSRLYGLLAATSLFYLGYHLIFDGYAHFLDGAVGVWANRLLMLALGMAGHLCIRVRNTGALAEGLASEAGPGIGNRNLRERLARVYGDRAPFNLRQEGEWVVAEARLPDTV